jgi:hypothetical protein
MIFNISNFISQGATVLELSSLNKTRIFTFNRPPRSHFLLFTNIALIKVVASLDICQHTNIHGLTLTGFASASTSNV